jgi:hypothetical protein
MEYIPRDPSALDFDDLPEWHQHLVYSFGIIGAIAGPILIWVAGGELSIGMKIVFTPISIFIGAGIGSTVGILLPLVLIVAVLGAVILLLIEGIGLIAPTVIPHLPTAAIAVFLYLLVFSLYWLRLRSLLLFGITKLLVGLIMISALAPIAIDLLKNSKVSDAQYAGSILLPWLTIIASVYFLIHGLIDTGQGVLGTKYEKMWNRLFGKKTK